MFALAMFMSCVDVMLMSSAQVVSFTGACGVGVYKLSVYSPFSERVGLPLHNIHIPSPFPSIMDIFLVDFKFCHIRFYTL